MNHGDPLIETTTLSPPAALSPEDLLRLVQTVLEDHKAEDIAVIDLRGKSTIGDYMVIASGASSRQVITMADRIVRALKERGVKGLKPEGGRRGDWVLIDAGDVIIHLFRPEVRAFYNLERMWEAELTTAESGAGL